MRSNRLIILALFVACKAATPSSSEDLYTEDLSVHRPEMTQKDDDHTSTSSEDVITKPYVALSGHIEAELDSISKVAYLQSKDGKMVEGYVIQVYSGNDRNKANEVRSAMYEFFPELKPKVTYHQPNFRVKAGKFTNRLEANRIHQQVKDQFPKALLIPDRFHLKYE